MHSIGWETLLTIDANWLHARGNLTDFYRSEDLGLDHITFLIDSRGFDLIRLVGGIIAAIHRLDNCFELIIGRWNKIRFIFAELIVHGSRLLRDLPASNSNFGQSI